MMEDRIEKAVLNYLSRGVVEPGSYQSVYKIYENVREELADDPQIKIDPSPLEDVNHFQRLLDEMASFDLLETTPGRPIDGPNYRLSDQGFYEASGLDQLVVEKPSAEGSSREGFAWTPVEPPLDDEPQAVTGEPLMTEDEQFIELETTTDDARTDVHNLEAAGVSTGPPEFSSPTLAIQPHDATIGHSVTEPEVRFHPSAEIDSAKWTGLSKVIIDARNARVVGALIDQAMLSLSTSQASNSQIMQATAYLRAAKELVDAPEPPSDEIWRFIGRAADIVGLLGLFCTIFAQALK